MNTTTTTIVLAVLVLSQVDKPNPGILDLAKSLLIGVAVVLQAVVIFKERRHE